MFGVLNTSNGNLVATFDNIDKATERTEQENKENPECFFMTIPI